MLVLAGARALPQPVHALDGRLALCGHHGRRRRRDVPHRHDLPAVARVNPGNGHHLRLGLHLDRRVIGVGHCVRLGAASARDGGGWLPRGTG